MNSSKTAKLLIYSSLFIGALIFTPLDLAITLTISVYLLINSKKIITIVGVSILLLLIDYTLRYFDVSTRFISDLSLDAYILFITAAAIYMKQQKNMMELFVKIRKKGKGIYWKHFLLVILISLSLSLLTFPLVGIYIATIVAYISFSYLIKRFEGKYAYIIALCFLIFCPFFIILKQDSLSESFAIFSFYFMIIGTIQEGIRLAGVEKYTIEKLLSGIKIDVKNDFSKNERTPDKNDIHYNFIHINTPPDRNAPPINILTPPKVYKVVVPVILLLVLGIAGYFLYSLNLIGKFANFPLAKTVVSPTIQIESSVVNELPTNVMSEQNLVIPTFAMSSISAQLKIKIENGTKISGLAASTSAQLKAAGFRNIITGDASQIFQNWEIFLKKDDKALVQFIKNTLAMNFSEVKQATAGAVFDIVIIAGENK